MEKNMEIVTSDEAQNDIEINIKAVMLKVNANIDRVFDGKVRSIYGLRAIVQHRPTALAIRVWMDIERKYPGLRCLLLNHDVEICEP